MDEAIEAEGDWEKAESTEAGDVVSKSRRELTIAGLKSLKAGGTRETQETLLRRFSFYGRLSSVSANEEQTHFFTTGRRVALDFGPHLDASITSRWRSGCVLPSFPQSATHTRHGPSRKTTSLFEVQASLLYRAPCTAMLVLSRKKHLVALLAQPVRSDGAS